MPQQLDARQIAALTTSTMGFATTIETLVQTNLLLTVLVGATAQELFGMIRQLQFFVTVSLIDINFPGHLHYFYLLTIKLSEVDVF